MTETAALVLQDFSELRRWLGGYDGQYAGLYENIRKNVRSKRSSKLVTDTPDAVMLHIKESAPQATLAQIAQMQKYIVGRCMVDNAPSLLERYCHAGVNAALHKNFQRIEASILDESAGYADYDFFIKDIVHVYGECIPCGAQSIALNGVVSFKSLLSRDAPGAFKNTSEWMKAVLQGGRNWFRTHTDSRILEDFNELGWDRCYGNIAAMLKEHPDILGMVATAWFYDPEILTISPRLSYLQSRPVERGAFLFRHGPAPHHTAWATEKSETRRRLVEEGKYLPQCYSMVWPRHSLLRWADSGEGGAT